MWINLDPKEVELFKSSLAIAHTTAPTFVEGAIQLLEKVAEWEKDSKSPLHRHFNEVAWEKYEDEGTWEIDRQSDGTAMVSISDDGGAYVMAWRWVADDDADICPSCSDFPGSETYGTVGDGYDGLCPSCADKAEEEDEGDDD